MPVPVDAPPPGAELPDPRRFDYETGWNLPGIPGQDGYRLASFSVLDTLSRLHSITRTCIERRKAMICGLDWDIVATKEASKAYATDNDAMTDFGKRRAEAVKFFRCPDPNFADFGDFMSALLEQVFVYDALSLLLKPKRGRGLGKGILGSDLDSLELVDGSTIRPLLSLSGGRPRPPAVGFQQYLKGVPRCDLQMMWDERDIRDAGLEGYKGPVFRSDQLIYKPIVPRVNSPYGFSAVEMALIVIMTGLRKQTYQLQYFAEGTIPGCFLSPGDPSITPTQIRELQAALNAVAGDQAFHHQIIVIPPNSKVMPQRATELADQFDEFLANEIAMVFDVDPMSLGMVPNVSSTVSPFAAREMAQASRSVHERTSTRPLLKFLCSIFNNILHRVLSQDDMKFTFAGMDEMQDQAAMTDMLVKQFQNGFISIDEAREELQRTAWGLDETSGPLILTQAGPVPLNQIIEMMRQQQGMAGGQNAAANSGNSVNTQPAAVHHPPSSRPVGTHNPRQGLPSGSGMRTGVPSSGASVSDTPAHSAAQGHARTTATGSRSRKAVMSELDALARHLRKGRHVSTWMPKYLSGVVMSTIAEDLTKGIGIDEAVHGAVTVALPASEYEWTDKAQPRTWPGWQQQAQLQQQYRQQVRAAFTQTATQARALIAAWLSGALAVTAAALAGMILAILARLLKAVLAKLWRDAWHLGHRSATQVAGTGAAADEAALEAWIASHGRDSLEGIEDTLAEELAAYLMRQAQAGVNPDSIAAGIPDILNADTRSDMISETEVQRANGEASRQAFAGTALAFKEWLNDPASNVCPKCLANAALGPIPFDAVYPDGSIWTPGHIRCACQCIGRSAEEVGKLARGRTAQLSGQEWWPAGSYPHGPAMGGGGPMHAAHDASGTQVYIPGGVPGMTAGGEPPRWPGSEAPAIVDDYDPGDSDGRTGGSRGGGTAGGPYRDGSAQTHTQPIDGGDDAAWPGERGVPPRPGTYWPAPYMDGYWPRGGNSLQAPASPVMAPADRGRPPNGVGKSGPGDLSDPNPVDPAHVIAVMEKNFPLKALEWVNDGSWVGPVHVPMDRVDFRDEDTWAAHHQPEAVNRFARQMKARNGQTHPVILVQSPDQQKAIIIDGHHRTLAARKLGWPVKAYLGTFKTIPEAALEAHSLQVHSGEDPANKNAKVSKDAAGYRKATGEQRCGNCVMLRKAAGGGLLCTKVEGPVEEDDWCRFYSPDNAEKGAKTDGPVAAGVAVRAADTGRILMLQRAHEDDDPAAGMWEFPGGRLEDGEDAYSAATREWAEETGCKLPDGDLTGMWNAGNGRYRGFVLTVPNEDAVDILGSRDDVDNPDDPDGDLVEALAWWDPRHLRDNPAVRPELGEDAKRVRRALKSAGIEKASERGRTAAEVLREYWTHEGHPGPTQYALEQKIRWGEPDDWYRCHAELTPYIGEEGAKGYCNLRHHEVLGYWPAQHREMEEGKA